MDPRGFLHPRFSPQGDRIAFTVGEGNTAAAGDIWTFDLETGELNRISFSEHQFYPAYSPGLGGYARWSAESTELFFIAIDEPGRPLMRVDVTSGDSFRTGPPSVVLADVASRFTTVTAPFHNWDVSPDGQRFVMVEFDRDESARVRIEFVLNWAQSS